MGIPHATRPGGFRGAVESQVERPLTRIGQVRPCPMRYPFSALAGQDQLKIPEWLLSTSEPDRTTGREIERPVPFVELPLPDRRFADTCDPRAPAIRGAGL